MLCGPLQREAVPRFQQKICLSPPQARVHAWNLQCRLIIAKYAEHCSWCTGKGKRSTKEFGSKLI
jgi:hypothetical protein